MTDNILLKAIVLIVTLLSTIHTAQTQFLTVEEDAFKCSLNDEEKKLYQGISSAVSTAKADIIKFAELSSVINGEFINVEIPNTNDYIKAKVIEVEFQDEDNYEWAGQTLNKTGHIILVKQDGYLGGSIRTESGKSYTIHPLSTSKSILVHEDISFYPTKENNINPSSSISENKEILCDEDNEECESEIQEIKVLFLVPNDVADRFSLFPNTIGIDIYARIAMFFTRITFVNSGLDKIRFIWVTRSIDFDYSLGNRPSIFFDTNKLRNDRDVIELREMEKAALVVMFTDRGYSSAVGMVSQIGPDRDDAYAIVEINAITTFTVTHELGHLLGARHQRQGGVANDNTDICCHGLDLGGRSTMMFTPFNNRQLQFTNAEQGIGDKDNNNALCMQNSACIVSTFFERVRSFRVDFSFDPNCLETDNEGNDITFTAEVFEPPFGFPGRPPYSYFWLYSLDCCSAGFRGFEDQGEATVVFNSDVINNQAFFVKLRVISDDNVTIELTKPIELCELIDDPCDYDRINISFNPMFSDCLTNSGSLQVIVESGTAPYTYAWSNGATTANISGLSAGNYEVTITDANNCQAISSYNLKGENTEAQITPRLKDTDCGTINGNIRLSLEGNAAPYHYEWSNGSTEKNQLGIGKGEYTVTVTDRYGCIAVRTYEIKERGGQSIDLIVTPTTCGEDNGAIDLTITGGTAPYNIQWDNNCGPTDEEDIFNLASGTYTVVVTDDNGCTATASAFVEQSNRLRILATSSPTSISQSNGSVSVKVAGGTPSYQYDWDHDGVGDFDDSDSVDGLAEGTYTVTVRDAAGCEATTTITVGIEKNSCDLSVSETIQNATCGGNNGAISLSLSGSSTSDPSLQFSWSNGASSKDINNVPAGIYTVTITTSSGCQLAEGFEVFDEVQNCGGGGGGGNGDGDNNCEDSNYNDPIVKITQVYNPKRGPKGESITIKVIGYPDEPDRTVDLSHWILDDNNAAAVDVGNEPGHIKLGSCFNAVPAGTVITFSNSGSKITVTGYACNEIWGSEGIPNHNNSSYNGAGYAIGGKWESLIPMRNSVDVVQLRNAALRVIDMVSWSSYVGGSTLNFSDDTGTDEQVATNQQVCDNCSYIGGAMDICADACVYWEPAALVEELREAGQFIDSPSDEYSSASQLTPYVCVDQEITLQRSILDMGCGNDGEYIHQAFYTVLPGIEMSITLDETIVHESKEIMLRPYIQGGNIASYLWSNGATTQSINIAENGTYTLEVEDSYGNKTKAYTFVELFDSKIAGSASTVYAVKTPQINVVPNPASKQIQVHFLNISEMTFIQQVEVVDILGKTIWTATITDKKSMNIDISTFPDGVYYITTTVDGKDIVIRFVKQE